MTLFGAIPFVLPLECLGSSIVVPILPSVESGFFAREYIISDWREDADCKVARPLALASGRDVELKLPDQPGE